MSRKIKFKALFMCAMLLLAVAFVGTIYAKAEVDDSVRFERFPLDLTEASKSKTEKKLLLSLSINDVACAYDEQSNTFYYALPLDGLRIPTFCFSFKSTDPDTQLVFDKKVLAFNKSEAQKYNQRFSFLAISSNHFVAYDLVFTGLPILSILTDDTPADDQSPIGDMDTKVSLSFQDPNFRQHKTEPLQKSNALMHIRGGITRRFPKKSYKLELLSSSADNDLVEKNDLSLLGMRKDNDWILNAMYSEDTRIRDKLSADIWTFTSRNFNQNGKHQGTRMEYVEVFINHRYWGIYSLTEPVDRKQLGLQGQDEAPQTDILYKGYKWGIRANDPSITTLQTWVELQFPDLSNEYVQYQTAIEHYKEELFAPLANLMTLTDYSSNVVFNKEIGKYIDVDHTVDFWLFLQIISGVDNSGKNMFFIARATHDWYRFSFCPWDMDLTWGSTWEESDPLLHRFVAQDVTDVMLWNLGNRVIRNDIQHSQELLRQRWLRLRQSVLSDQALTQRIDNYLHQLEDSGAYSREQKRWDTADFRAAIGSLKSFALARMKFLDDYIISRTA